VLTIGTRLFGCACAGLQRTGNFHAAIELYKQALRMQPKHAIAWFNLGERSNRQQQRVDSKAESS